MPGAFNSPEQRRKPAINMTPLIDVMFLLLIFFMVSSTFREESAIDITLPQAESASTQELKATEIIVDAEGVIYLGEAEVSEAGLRSALAEILDADPAAALVLRADEGADFGRVLRVIDIARDLNAPNLIIPTDPLEANPEDL